MRGANVMLRLTAEDYAVDAVTGAKAFVGAWLCRRMEDGSVVRRRRLSLDPFADTRSSRYCKERTSLRSQAPRL